MSINGVNSGNTTTNAAYQEHIKQQKLKKKETESGDQSAQAAAQQKPPPPPPPPSSTTDVASTVSNIQSLISRLPSGMQGLYSSSLSSAQSGKDASTALSTLQGQIESVLAQQQIKSQMKIN